MPIIVDMGTHGERALNPTEQEMGRFGRGEPLGVEPDQFLQRMKNVLTRMQGEYAQQAAELEDALGVAVAKVVREK